MREYSEISGTEAGPETSENIRILTLLSAWEHFIEFCGQESFKTEVSVYLSKFKPAERFPRKAVFQTAPTLLSPAVSKPDTITLSFIVFLIHPITSQEGPDGE